MKYHLLMRSCQRVKLILLGIIILTISLMLIILSILVSQVILSRGITKGTIKLLYFQIGSSHGKPSLDIDLSLLYNQSLTHHWL